MNVTIRLPLLLLNNHADAARTGIAFTAFARFPGTFFGGGWPTYLKDCAKSWAFPVFHPFPSECRLLASSKFSAIGRAIRVPLGSRQEIVDSKSSHMHVAFSMLLWYHFLRAFAFLLSSRLTPQGSRATRKAWQSRRVGNAMSDVLSLSTLFQSPESMFGVSGIPESLNSGLPSSPDTPPHGLAQRCGFSGSSLSSK